MNGGTGKVIPFMSEQTPIDMFGWRVTLRSLPAYPDFLYSRLKSSIFREKSPAEALK